MPKMKTKSGAKKRFRLTATGRVKMGASRRRHGLVNRPKKMKRHSRGSVMMSEPDTKVVKKFFLPWG
jgi:large subunit ribosomal protein L35